MGIDLIYTFKNKQGVKIFRIKKANVFNGKATVKLYSNPSSLTIDSLPLYRMHK